MVAKTEHLYCPLDDLIDDVYGEIDMMDTKNEDVHSDDEYYLFAK